MSQPGSDPDRSGGDFWYLLLTAFPFLFLPLLVLGGIALALIMPILTGVSSR